ncbi:TPA: VENN motif pre-toxin domain-containing protein, partial [Klebsiella aerogenes]
ANQQQDVTGLSRDTAHANQTLSPIFDKEKEQNRLATAQKIGEIGRQVSDVLVMQGKLNAQAAQSDPAARAKLVAGGNGSPSEEQISALSTLAAGLMGGLSGGSSADAVAGAQAGKNAVENNALSDIAEQLASGQSPAEKLDKLNKAEEERFSREECAGLSPDTCGAKMYDQRREALKDMASLGADFLPVVGDFKSYAEAEDWIDYTLATVGLIPGADFVTKPLKEAKQLLKAGDLNGANKLLQETSDQISSVTRPGHRQSEIDVGNDLGDGWKEQVSYKDGKEVPYGTKGSTRPDWCNGDVCSLEVKNYNVATNQGGLINNVAKQAIERQKHLPQGMMQEIVIDVRGQVLSLAQEDAIVRGIVQKSNGIVKPTNIQFKR